MLCGGVACRSVAGYRLLVPLGLVRTYYSVVVLVLDYVAKRSNASTCGQVPAKCRYKVNQTNYVLCTPYSVHHTHLHNPVSLCVSNQHIADRFYRLGLLKLGL